MHFPVRFHASVAALLWLLFSPQATGAEPVPRRHVVLSELPKGQEVEIRIAADVPTLVRFESALDPAETRLQEQPPSRFESLDVLDHGLLLHPPSSSWLWPRLHLRVRLADGTRVSFVLVPSAPVLADGRVDVFLHSHTVGALENTLMKVSADYEVLEANYERTLAELTRTQVDLANSRTELARSWDDAYNPDVAIATLLLDEKVAPLLLNGRWSRLESPALVARCQCVRLVGRSACLVHVENRHPSGVWMLTQRDIYSERTGAPLRIIARARPFILPPGGSARVVLVTQTPPSADTYSVQLSASGGPEWQLYFNRMEL